MADSFSYLSGEKRESLQGLPFPVVLPTSLPQGWSLGLVEVDSEDGETDVQVVFEGPGAAHLTFWATDGGVGDALPGESQEEYAHPLLGKIFLERYEQAEPDDFRSQWLEIEDCDGFTSFRGASVAEQELSRFLETLDLFEPSGA